MSRLAMLAHTKRSAELLKQCCRKGNLNAKGESRSSERVDATVTQRTCTKVPIADLMLLKLRRSSRTGATSFQSNMTEVVSLPYLTSSGFLPRGVGVRGTVSLVIVARVFAPHQPIMERMLEPTLGVRILLSKASHRPPAPMNE